jgi:hypothetical protein
VQVAVQHTGHVPLSSSPSSPERALSSALNRLLAALPQLWSLTQRRRLLMALLSQAQSQSQSQQQQAGQSATSSTSTSIASRLQAITEDLGRVPFQALAYLDSQSEEEDMDLLGDDDGSGAASQSDDGAATGRSCLLTGTSSTSDYESGSASGSGLSDTDVARAMAARRARSGLGGLAMAAAGINGGVAAAKLLRGLSLFNPVGSDSTTDSANSSSSPTDMSPTIPRPGTNPFGIGYGSGRRRTAVGGGILGSSLGRGARAGTHNGPATPLQRAVLLLGQFASGLHFQQQQHGHVHGNGSNGVSQLQGLVLELFVSALQYLRPRHIHASVVAHVLATLCSSPPASLLRVHYVKALVSMFGRGTEPGLQQQQQQATSSPQQAAEQGAVPNVSACLWFDF